MTVEKDMREGEGAFESLCMGFETNAYTQCSKLSHFFFTCVLLKTSLPRKAGGERTFNYFELIKKL